MTCHEFKTENAKKSLPTQEIVENTARLFKALGDPTRMKIICALAKDELCVSCLADTLNMEQSAISHQLKILRDLRVISSRREGKSIFYSLNDDHIFDIVNNAVAHMNITERRKGYVTRT